MLTDPWFSEKAHYHHGEPLGMALENLPELGAVIATHEHYDHFDIETFRRYPHKDVPFFVGPNLDRRRAGRVPWQARAARRSAAHAAENRPVR